MPDAPVMTPARTRPEPRTMEQDVLEACLRIPPCWDLRSFVAVNPFLGHAHQPLADAAAELRDAMDARVLPAVEAQRTRWREGAFDSRDLLSAAGRLGADPAELEALLEGRAPLPQRTRCAVPTFAERVDRERGTAWNDAACGAIARWCELEAMDGRLFETHGRSSPFERWRAFASTDLSVDAAGLPGFRAAIRGVPAEPDAAIDAALSALGISAATRLRYLQRLLSGIQGWAAQARRIAWQRDRMDPGAVRHLLAARACADAAVWMVATRGAGGAGGARTAEMPPQEVEDERPLLALQEAAEDGWMRRLLESMRRGPGASQAPATPRWQAVFCIDVRSEPLRRHLERLSPQVETLGFAGFFGVAMRWESEGHASERCPVLLSPALEVRGAPPADGVAGELAARMLGAPASGFASMELAGLAFGAGLAVREACVGAQRRREETARIGFACSEHDHGDGRGEPAASIDAEVALAEGILRGTGLAGRLAPLVLLCGHAACSANNPHASSLDCGACGGHGGAPNARVAAALLNHPRIRRGLAARGTAIPEGTHFLPAVHDTSDDSVRLLDAEHAPASHKDHVERLRTMLEAAGAAVRAERAASLGVAVPASRGARLLRAFRRRARDWGQVRPEWGLAGNAAFIAAPRSRTRGVDLSGRAFLHDYDHRRDPEGSLLEVILAAPMVVASWINLQYLASTVDNGRFGAGDKVLHNRVGSTGVVEGNGGDLRTGLPLQSVRQADGRWRHEPLRLQVLVEAPAAAIDGVLAAQPHVRQLVLNGWVRLFALEPQGHMAWRLVPGRGWEPA